MPSSTFNCFSNFIVIENFFCINRCYLIENLRTRTIGNIIFFLSSFMLIGVGFNYVLTSNTSVGMIMFQLSLAIEFIDLTITARMRRSTFNAFKRLDEKCGIDDDYIAELTGSATKNAFFIFVSVIIDAIGLKLVNASPSEIVIYCVLLSAQDAELMFISLIVEAINLRLSKLKDTAPVFGSKVYRHVLVTTALLNEEFTPRILLMLTIILGTTVTYSSVVMLSLTDTGASLLVYLLWREIKAFFCLWKVCYASWKSERICQQLAFGLAKTLALDLSVDKGKNPQAYKIIHRWYSTVLSAKPRFVSGSVVSIGLDIPFHLLDLSVNYVLIIVQVQINNMVLLLSSTMEDSYSYILYTLGKRVFD